LLKKPHNFGEAVTWFGSFPSLPIFAEPLPNTASCCTLFWVDERDGMIEN